MVVIVHNVRSVHNVGSIFRTADGAGVEKIYLTGYTPAPIDKLGHKIKPFTKVSLGAEDAISWEKTKNVNKAIARLKKDGFKIFAVEQSPHSVLYCKLPTKNYKLERVALMVGNEVRGLSPALLKRCDRILEIPMRGEKESLNVSVAFGIVAHYLANVSR